MCGYVGAHNLSDTWLSCVFSINTCTSGNQTWQWKIHHLNNVPSSIWRISIYTILYSWFLWRVSFSGMIFPWFSLNFNKGFLNVSQLPRHENRQKSAIGKSPQYGGFSGNNIELMGNDGKWVGKIMGNRHCHLLFSKVFFMILKDPGSFPTCLACRNIWPQSSATSVAAASACNEKLLDSFFPDVSSDITRQVCCTYFCHCDHCSDVVKLTESWTEGWNLTKKWCWKKTLYNILLCYNQWLFMSANHLGMVDTIHLWRVFCFFVFCYGFTTLYIRSYIVHIIYASIIYIMCR